MERPVTEVKRPCDNRDSVQLRCRTRVSHALRALLRSALRVARHERDRLMIYLLGGSGYIGQAYQQFLSKTPRSNCAMDSTKLGNTGIHMTEVHEAIIRVLENWESSLVHG